MKIISELEAIKLIKDNDTLGIGTSSAGWTVPEALLKKLGEVYHKDRHPQNITISTAVTPGAFNDEKLGINHLVEEGLVGKLISAHVNAGKSFSKCISNNQFPTYTIPLGVYGKLLRAMISNESGYLTHIGLNTFADPRVEGCKANKKATEDIVELVKIGNQEKLFYKTFPINVCFIRASFADKEGNISFSKEPIIGDQVELAAATHNQGGIVIVQVDKVVKQIPPKEVAIHKSLIDYVVICKDIYSYSEEYTKYQSKLFNKKKKKIKEKEKIAPLDARKICGRRACLELEKNNIVNLGVGMPESVAMVAKEEKIFKDITLSVEMGPLGGIPLGGKTFGAALYPEAVMSINQTMDLYDGGFLNVSVLGLAEMDKYGNVNVSKFNNRIAGPGGFIDISQTTKKIIFVGTFTSGNLKEKIEGNQLKIIEEGNIKKFKEKVDQITFASKEAIKNNQEVLYITERAVFKLTEEGIMLTEIAPGIDLEKDILANMNFSPIISKNLKLMDLTIFLNQPMGLNIDNIPNKKILSKFKRYFYSNRKDNITLINQNESKLKETSNIGIVGGEN